MGFDPPKQRFKILLQQLFISSYGVKLWHSWKRQRCHLQPEPWTSLTYFSVMNSCGPQALLSLYHFSCSSLSGVWEHHHLIINNYQTCLLRRPFHIVKYRFLRNFQKYNDLWFFIKLKFKIILFEKCWGWWSRKIETLKMHCRKMPFYAFYDPSVFFALLRVNSSSSLLKPRTYRFNFCCFVLLRVI